MMHACSSLTREQVLLLASVSDWMLTACCDLIPDWGSVEAFPALSVLNLSKNVLNGTLAGRRPVMSVDWFELSSLEGCLI